MQEQSYIIFAGQREWQICAISDGDMRFANVTVDKPSAQQAAGLAADALREQGYRGHGVLLALPSLWCHSANVSTADLPRRNRTAMLYRLEEKLPFPAEGMVADFIAAADEQSALGVCCQLEVVEPIVQSLESQGIKVQSIAPADLLALQQLQSMKIVGDRIVVCADCESSAGVNLVAFVGGRLTAWSRTTADNFRFELELLSSEFQPPPPVQFVEENGELKDTEAPCPQFTAAHGTANRAAAARAARQALLGRAQPWIELRRDSLAAPDALELKRRPLNALLASAVVLLLAAALVMGVRALRYHRLEASNRQQLEDRFRRQFPGWAVPPNLKIVIESEHRKAAEAMRTLPPEARKSAIRTLADVLGRLPAEDRFTANSFHFDDDWFDMQGEIGSFEQLDAIAKAVRQSGMDVRAPDARRLPGGTWSFTLHGSYPSVTTARGG